MRKRKSFSQELKRKAARLMETLGRLPADLVRELGVRHNQLYKRKERLMKKGGGAFPGPGRRSGSGVEVALLRRLHGIEAQRKRRFLTTLSCSTIGSVFARLWITTLRCSMGRGKCGLIDCP